MIVHRRWLALLAVALVLVLTGCGSSSNGSSAGGASSSSSTTHFAKTKFVLHAGLAFGAFHRYIYKPLRAGAFSHPFSHKLTIIKAGLAALFIRHELRLALADARASPTLSKLVAPITALEAKIAALRHGTPDAAAVGQDNGAIGSIEHSAAGAGQPITEQAPASV
jgi:hypothetical protein